MINDFLSNNTFSNVLEIKIKEDSSFIGTNNGTIIETSYNKEKNEFKISITEMRVGGRNKFTVRRIYSNNQKEIEMSFINLTKAYLGEFSPKNYQELLLNNLSGGKE